MEVDNRECSKCGSTEWNLIVEKSYPDRESRERDKTEQEVYDCKECGAQGKRFEDGNDGVVSYSGAMR
jgi:DNA-directed RNA polymerase subunit M/transcription elongation factor TFIIS